MDGQQAARLVLVLDRLADVAEARLLLANGHQTTGERLIQRIADRAADRLNEPGRG